jgi:hypothetical protein
MSKNNKDPRTPSPSSNNNQDKSSSASSWSLNESSLPSWFQYFQNPGTILLLSSIPFCVGGYVGFQMPSKKLEELAGVTDVDEKISLAEKRRLGVKYGARAFRLATLGTVGVFGMVGAAGFYASGYRSVEEALTRTRIWASTSYTSFESWLNMEDRPSKTHPEVLATKHMNEEQELNYIYEKYIKEEEEDDTLNANEKP